MITDKLAETPHFFSGYTYTNDVELLDTVVNIFSATLRSSLTSKERVVLRFYLKDGYSPKTKQSIRIDLRITAKNLDQINFNLKKKGFLRSHPTNGRSKEINKELVRMKNCFLGLDGAKGLYIIGFLKNE